jgi:hypothetical protein
MFKHCEVHHRMNAPGTYMYICIYIYIAYWYTLLTLSKNSTNKTLKQIIQKLTCVHVSNKISLTPEGNSTNSDGKIVGITLISVLI